MRKKLISLLLVCVMIFTLLPTAALAGDETDQQILSANAGDTIEISEAGTYSLPGSIPENITIKGTVSGVVFDCVGSGSIASIPNGCTFENVTMNFGQSAYHGFQHAGPITMKNCTLNGLFFSYGDMTFDTCVFNQTSKEYCMWCYAGDLTYTGCTFNTHGKVFNVYNENNGPHKLTVNSCTFNNSDDVYKPAVLIKSKCGTAELEYDVEINGTNTLSGSWPSADAVYGDGNLQTNGLWDVEGNGEKITVTVDGEKKYPAEPVVLENKDLVKLQVKENQEKGITEEVVSQISGNTAVTEFVNTGLSAAYNGKGSGNFTVQFTLNDATPAGGEVPQLKYEVVPTLNDARISNDKLSGEPIRFRLPLTNAFANVEVVKVVHHAASGDVVESYAVQGEVGALYVEVITPSFSEFDVFDPQYKLIGDGFYQNGDTYEASTEFYITNLNGLKLFRDIVNTELLNNDYYPAALRGTVDYTNLLFSGKTVELLADIDLNNEEWVPIGNQYDKDGNELKGKRFFYGIFDGNNKTISNLKMDTSNHVAQKQKSSYRYGSGLFGRIASTATVKDLIISNVDIKATYYAGALAGDCGSAEPNVTVTNVKVTGNINISGYSFVGGIAGHGLYNMSNCSVIATTEQPGTITGSVWQIGGIGGTSRAGTSVTSCQVKNVDISVYYYFAGGIVGNANGNVTGCTTEKVTINAYNNSAQFDADYCGAIVGAVEGDNHFITENSPKKAGQCGSDYDEETTVIGWDIVGTLEDGGVTGGTFEALPDSFVASGYEKVAQGTTPETWVVQKTKVAQIVETEEKYETLAEAINAVQNGETIKMLCNAAVDSVIDISEKQFTIDLNETTLTTLIDDALTVSGTAELTICNGSIAHKCNAETPWEPIFVKGDKASSLTLNGVKITSKMYSVYVSSSSMNKTITIKDCEFTSTGDGVIAAFGANDFSIKDTKLSSSDTNTAVIQVAAKALIENVEIESSAPGIFYNGLEQEGAVDVTIANVTINTNGEAAIISSGNRSDAKLTINGGSFTNTGGQALYLPGKDTVIINGGTFTGKEAAVIKAGDITINGGIFRATGAAINPTTAGSSGAASTGDAIYVEDNYGVQNQGDMSCTKTFKHEVKLTINGGTFTSTNAYALSARFADNDDTAPANVAVRGGMFKSGTGKEPIYTGNSFNGTIAASAGYYDKTVPAAYISPGYACFALTDLDPAYAEGYRYIVKRAEVQQETKVEVSDDKVVSGGKQINVEGMGGDDQPTAQQVAAAINKAIQTPGVSVETKIEQATPASVTMQDGNFDISKVLNAVKEAAKDSGKNLASNSDTPVDATAVATADGQITVKNNYITDEKVTKKIQIDLTTAAVTMQTEQASTTTQITTMTYDVKPVATVTVTDGNVTETVTAVIPNDAITAPISFRLGVPSHFTGLVKVTHHHDNTNETFYSMVLGSGDEKYVELSSKTFSEWTIEAATTESDLVIYNGQTYTVTADPAEDINVRVKPGGTLKYQIDPTTVNNVNVVVEKEYPEDALGVCKVTFNYAGGVDSEGMRGMIKAVKPGSSVNAPAVQMKNTGGTLWYFTGWDKTVGKINEDTEFTAQYETTAFAVSLSAADTTITKDGGVMVNVNVADNNKIWNDAEITLSYDKAHLRWSNTHDPAVTEPEQGTVKIRIYGPDRLSTEKAKTLVFIGHTVTGGAETDGKIYVSHATVNPGISAMSVDVTPANVEAAALHVKVVAATDMLSVSLGNGLSYTTEGGHIVSTVAKGSDFKAKINDYDAGYDYTVKNHVATLTKDTNYTIGDDGTLTLLGAYTGTQTGNMVLTLKKTLHGIDEGDISIYEDFVGGYSLVLVDATNATAQNLAYNGATMYYATKYNAQGATETYAFIVKGLTDSGASKDLVLSKLTPTKADKLDLSKKNLTTNTAWTANDVNDTGTVDLNDVQAVWNCYNVNQVKYPMATYMAVYLRADVNNDYVVNAEDISAVFPAN